MSNEVVINDSVVDDSVWVENLKRHSALIMEITDKIVTPIQAAEILQITQPRVSALIKNKINDSHLKGLVDTAHRLGLHISPKVAA